jgi:hypothetical protein
VKWGGLAMCCLFVGVWLGSSIWVAVWASERGQYVGLDKGAFIAGFLDPLEGPETRSGWILGWRSHFGIRWWFDYYSPGHSYGLVVPLWVPAFVALVCSSVVWRVDIRAGGRTRRNHCPTCNYNRRGLPGASPCPECGSLPGHRPGIVR